MVRYKLAKDTKYIYQNADSPDKETVKINVRHEQGIYFLDILGKCKLPLIVEVRVFAPNGDVICGQVLKDYIELTNKDELFDSRFNSDKANHKCGCACECGECFK